MPFIGAATKAGPKKTNNFDMCRDVSGRRSRSMNAEKRVEDSKASQEERRLEKVLACWRCKKGVDDGEAHKYAAKYREESEQRVTCARGVAAGEGWTRARKGLAMRRHTGMLYGEESEWCVAESVKEGLMSQW